MPAGEPRDQVFLALRAKDPSHSRHASLLEFYLRTPLPGAIPPSGPRPRAVELLRQTSGKRRTAHLHAHRSAMRHKLSRCVPAPRERTSSEWRLQQHNEPSSPQREKATLASTGRATPQPRVDHHAKADRNRGQRAAQGTSGGWRTAYFHAHIPATCQRPSELYSRCLNGRLMLRATCCRIASQEWNRHTKASRRSSWSQGINL